MFIISGFVVVSYCDHGLIIPAILKIRGYYDPCSRLRTEVRHALFYDSLSLSLLVPAAASAQQARCAALPAKPPIQTGTANQNANRAALAAVLKSPDVAAKKLVFAQQLAKLDSDPAVMAQRANHRRLFSDLVNAPEHQKQPGQMAKQVAAAQSSASLQNQKAVFEAASKCATP